jgi:hypothetical protein
VVRPRGSYTQQPGGRCLTTPHILRHSAGMSLGLPFALGGLTVTGFVAIGITAYLLGASRPATRFTVSVLVLLIAALVAFTPLLLIVTHPEARAALQEQAHRYAQTQKMPNETPQAVVQQWMALYGTDTLQGAALTTTRFREGKDATAWATRTHLLLQEIKYERLEGAIVSSTILGDTAVVTVRARISAIDGVATHTELYTLQQLNGQWLIDALEVKDEVLSGDVVDQQR